jgi:AbiU2
MTMARARSPFEHELEVFRTEEESAQQYFFGFLSLQLIPHKNADVLRQMNETSMFWITTRYALLMSAFVVLGRIFDQDPKSLHNIDKLLTAVSNEIGALSRAGLMQRRIAEGMDPQQAVIYVASKYDLTVEDVRDMRKAVGKWRKVYEARYREIRHKIFAHKSLSRTDADKLMANTNIDEIKELLGFLHSLYTSLCQLHINGVAPVIAPATFGLPPLPGGSKAGERMYRESGDLLYGMLDR